MIGNLRRALGALAVFVFVLQLSGARGGEIETLERLLKREIIGPDLSMEEAQVFTENRVPVLKTPATAKEWPEESERLRKRVLDEIAFRGEAARAWRDAKTGVEWLDKIPGGPGYTIQKLRYEALPGMWIPALLYLPDKLEGRVPVVLNVNGHDPVGKAAPYKQIRCINQVKRGMIVLNVEWFGMGQLRTDGFNHARMNQLDLCGASGWAPFILNMQRTLDILLAQPHADSSRVAVMGLSGGGWGTIIISALDPRVTLANPVAGYSSFRTRARHLSDLGDSEQTPNDLATIADYTHLTAMRAPKPTLLTFNSKDNCCFASGHALQPLLDAVQPVYQLFEKPDALRSHINDDPGTHNFERDNREAVYRMTGDFFYPGDANYSAVEIPSEGEVKTPEELNVPLPDGPNEDFHTLAMKLAAGLPKNPALPTTLADAQKWQVKGREQLKNIVRYERDDVRAEKVGEETADGITAAFWKLHVGGKWTVPAVELVRGGASTTNILIADAGRAAAAQQTAELLAAKSRVLVIDPFYLGESKIKERDYLFALLVAGVGSRPLGVQAGQVAAIARWARTEFTDIPVDIAAVGPRASLVALVAGAIEPNAMGAVMLSGSMTSLREVITNDMTVDKTPELFCFGLLEVFDLKHLAALNSPRRVYWVGADGLPAEWGDLAAFEGLTLTEE